MFLPANKTMTVCCDCGCLHLLPVFLITLYTTALSFVHSHQSDWYRFNLWSFIFRNYTFIVTMWVKRSSPLFCEFYIGFVKCQLWFVDTAYLKLYYFYFLHGWQHIIFVTRGVFLFEPCAYCWQSRKCFARALCANASTALITKAQAIVAAKWYAATRADIQRQKFQYAMRLSGEIRQTAFIDMKKPASESMISFVLYV